MCDPLRSAPLPPSVPPLPPLPPPCRDRIRCFFSLVRVTCVPATPVASDGEGGAPLSAGSSSSKAVDLVVGILETACITARGESEALACPTEPLTGERQPPTEAAAVAGVAVGGGGSRGRLTAQRAGKQGSPSLPSPAPPTPALRQLPRLQAAALDVLRSSRAIQHMCMQAAGVLPSATLTAAAVASAAYSEPNLTASPSSSVAEKAVSPSTSFTPGPATKGSMPSHAASDGGSSYTSSWEDEESDRSSAAVAAAAAALGRDMAAACMCVGGVSVLSPRLRYLYDGWFVPHEDQAVHEFTRQA